jgi:hypothetical protein
MSLSEERLQRMEDMIGQLIGMVGKVVSDQHGMRSDMNDMKVHLSKIDDRLERIEIQTAQSNDTISYLMNKTAEHDRDIHFLKSRLLKT